MAATSHCESCGATLAVHQRVRGGYCDLPRCRIAHFSGARRERRQARRRELERIRSELVRRGLPAETPLASLPSNDARLAPLPERRRRAFRDHLTRTLAEAAAVRARRDAEPPESPYPSFPAFDAGEAELALLGHGCAACRGRCCQNGGVRAYLDARSLHRFMAEHPDLRPRHVLEAYLSRLPARSYEGSCVFHAEEGCSLPREMRSDTCNGFFCGDLARLRDVARASGSKRVLAAAFHGVEVRRAALLDAERTEPVRTRALEPAPSRILRSRV